MKLLTLTLIDLLTLSMNTINKWAVAQTIMNIIIMNIIASRLPQHTNHSFIISIVYHRTLYTTILRVAL